jgi:DNA-binding transcriptional LysR family regulator
MRRYQSQRAVRITRAAGSDGLVVGFYGSAATELLPRLLRVFGERHPAVEVSRRTSFWVEST